MSNQTKAIIVGLAFFLLCCVASYFVGRDKGSKIGWNSGYSAGWSAGYEAPHPGDTTATIDTSHYDHPDPVDVQPAAPVDDGREQLLLGTIADLRAQLDSLASVKPDTAYVEVAVPIEVKTYEESTYRAQVSGFRPQLDWIEVYQRTQTITQYIEHKAPRWSFGITAGPGVLYDGKVHAGIGIVAGLQYRF